MIFANLSYKEVINLSHEIRIFKIFKIYRSFLKYSKTYCENFFGMNFRCQKNFQNIFTDNFIFTKYFIFFLRNILEILETFFKEIFQFLKNIFKYIDIGCLFNQRTQLSRKVIWQKMLYTKVSLESVNFLF